MCPSPNQHWFFSVLCLIALLVGVKQPPTVLRILLFLITNDMEHLFIHSLAICIHPLEKYLFKYFAPFKKWVVF